MQVGAVLYDWEWVNTAKDYDHLMEMEEEGLCPEGASFADSEFLDWADSAMRYYEVCDFLDLIVDDPDEPLSQEINRSLTPLISNKYLIDEMNYGEQSEDCCIVSVSPERVNQMSEAASKIDLNRLYEAIQAKVEPNYTTVFESKERYIEYLKQWVDILSIAADKKMGILVSVG